jgi:4-hydroxy-2-oxoheptanedioate aldolase
MRDLKAAVAAGKKPVGTFIWDFGVSFLPKIFKNAGYDYVILDNEHGCFSYETLLDAIHIARGCDIAALVRVPKIDRECVQRYWDMGADGIVVPMVNTPEQAREVVRLSKYAPMGERGLAFYKGNMDFNMDADPRAYMKESNEKGFILVQCETVRGLENIDAIAAVQGVDGIFFGPLDFSGDMGLFGDYQNPSFKEAAAKVIKAARAAGKIAAAFVGDMAQAGDRLSDGANFLTYGTESAMLYQAAKGALREIQGLSGYRG